MGGAVAITTTALLNGPTIPLAVPEEAPEITAVIPALRLTQPFETASEAVTAVIEWKPSKTTAAVSTTQVVTASSSSLLDELRNLPNTGWGAASSHIAQVGHLIELKFGVDTILGKGSRPNASDHSTGRALDFMVNKATGDEIAQYFIDNAEDLRVKYVIWYAKYWQPGQTGWTAYTHPNGSTDPTSLHMDHVHVSFK